MPRYDVAHVKEQGVDLIIIPLDSMFGHKTSNTQQEIIAELQVRAHAAGLAGAVVPIWDSGGGRMAFMAPSQWHSFFSSIDFRWVAANINRELFW
ncbi:MAG: hypothetical protein ACLP6G_01450 [Terriglobales bacterium]